MKILFVNNFRGRGGGEEFLRELLPGLAGKGFEVGLICRPGTPLAEMFRNSAVNVFPIDRSGSQAISAVVETARTIRSRGYDIVNIQRGHDIVQSWLGMLISGRRPILMYTPQVPEFIRSRFLLRRMDSIVTISRYIRDRLASFDRALQNRISIIYYGIDLANFRPGATDRGTFRKRFGIAQHVPVLGTVGDLWKNQIEFLDVLKEVTKSHAGARYAIVGARTQNELTRTFDVRAAELGLTDAVLWLGRLSKSDMLSFYADIDLAVSTYRNEGFGIWILEAMAMGRPAVSYNAGGIRDSLEGSPSGVLVDGGPQQMAEAIAGLLADRRKRENMAAAAPRWVRDRFGRERMVDDYVRYFHSLLLRKKGNSGITGLQQT